MKKGHREETGLGLHDDAVARDPFAVAEFRDGRGQRRERRARAAPTHSDRTDSEAHSILREGFALRPVFRDKRAREYPNDSFPPE
ncbi:hypothetical protein C5E09_03550 [Rathayibacter iranicus]|nr:hypothetical protein C5E09_03550 [Rathayibacter iranicus]PPI72068.1 hypothetical protein C5E01_06165 [Rathayibacter iranicus]